MKRQNTIMTKLLLAALLIVGPLLISGCGEVWGGIGVKLSKASVFAPENNFNSFSSQLGQSSQNTYTYSIKADSQGNIVSSGMTTGFLGGTQFGSHGIQDLVISKFDSKGKLIWGNQLGQAGESTTGNGIVQDSNGNSYIVGTTSASLGGVQYGVHGTRDLLLAKFDSNGSLLWVNQLGNAGNWTMGSAIAIDQSGNFYVTGQNQGSLGGVQYGTSGIWNVFVAKFSASGALVWVNQLGQAAQSTSGYSIAIDSVGNSFVTGYTDGSLGGSQLGTHGFVDMIISKWDPTGTLAWVNQLGQVGQETWGASIIEDVNGNSYITGYASGSVGGTQYGSHGNYDLFILKLSASGTPIWASQLGQTGTDTRGFDLIQSSSGNIIVTGETRGYLGGIQYGTHMVEDILLAEFNQLGALVFANQVGGGSSTGRAVTQNSSGVIFVTGYSDSVLGTQYGTHGFSDLVVMDFDPNGYH